MLKQDFWALLFFRKSLRNAKLAISSLGRKWNHLVSPPTNVYRRSGGVYARLILLHKKFAFLGALMLALTYGGSLLGCCNLCFTIDSAGAKPHYLNATQEEKMIMSGSQIEDVFLAGQKPLREQYLFAGALPNALVFLLAALVLYGTYVFRFIRLLRRRFFQLDSSSVFRDVFSSKGMFRRRRPVEADRHWGNYRLVKSKMLRRYNFISR